MRIHGIACCYVLFFAFRLGLGRGETACLLLAMGAVTAAEAMNTSVEKLCDYVEKKHVRQIGLVKDLAAGAVVLSALFAALAGGVVFLRPALWEVLWEIAGSPLELGGLILSLAVSSILVFAVPLKR